MKIYSDVEHLNPIDLKEAGIKGVIFDLDDTLVPEFSGRLAKNMLDKIQQISEADLQIAIVTNNNNSRYCAHIINQIEPIKENIYIIQNAYKPFPRSLHRIQQLFFLKAHEIALVGDGILTDRLGSWFRGVTFIQANWFARPFYKHPILFTVRELLVILSDGLRYLLLGHRPRLTILRSQTTEHLIAKRHFLFLFNKNAGTSNLEEIQDLISRQFSQRFQDSTDHFNLHIFDNPRRIHSLFSQVIAEGIYTDVIISGGDGSVREAIALIAKNNPENTTLGILPTGTGNLFAKALGIPLDITEAFKVIMGSGVIQRHTIMRVNGTYAASLAGIGADGEIMTKTDTRLKKRLGPFAYLWAGIKVALSRKPALFHLALDDQKPFLRRADSVMLIQRNAFIKAFFPNLTVENNNESYLDVCIIKSKGLLDVARALHQLFINNLDRDNTLIEHYTCTKAKVQSFPPKMIQIDGDGMGFKPLTVKTLPHFIQIHTPAKSLADNTSPAADNLSEIQAIPTTSYAPFIFF